MLYRTLKRMIERGQTNGLEEKDRHFLRSRQADRKRVSGAHRHAQGRMNAPED